MYVYELGVIEKHGTGDTSVFICDHRGDMQRLAARMNELTAENAKLREQLAEAMELLSRLNYTFLSPYDTSAIDAFVVQIQDANNANH